MTGVIVVGLLTLIALAVHDLGRRHCVSCHRGFAVFDIKNPKNGRSSARCWRCWKAARR